MSVSNQTHQGGDSSYPLIHSVGTAVYGLDGEGRVTFINPEAAGLLGWDDGDPIGSRQSELLRHTRLDGTAYDDADCPILSVFAQGQVHFIDDNLFWRRDGTSFPVEYVAAPLFDEKGGPSGAIVTFRDVTRRVEAERGLSEMQRQNQSILESAGEGIYGLDAEGNTTFVNPAAARILGWTVEELIGKPQHAIIHHSHPNGDPYPREECPIYAAFTDGKVHRKDDEVFWRRDGTSLPVEYVSTPIRNEDGGLAGAVVSFIDITERKKQQEALENALAEVRTLKDRLEKENEYLQEEIRVEHNFEEIIGNSAALKSVLTLLEKVATTDATVLVNGETGVGKELFARAVHYTSNRSDRAFVKVNCAALPEHLIESELFGHERGSFTGATSQRIGRFELAHGGTLFLDEIGELPLELQAKLLRVLQEGELERIGGTRTISVDVRIIAASNRDLMKAVWTGTFRDDLYYRLNVFPVEVPALRDRREDIPLLVSHFVKKYSAAMGKPIDHVSEQAKKSLQSYDWPGNVRELENIIERGVILASGGVLCVEEAIEMHPPERGAGPDRRTLESVERDHILQVMDLTDWRIQGPNGAAIVLDIHPNTLRSRMKKLGIEKKVGPA